ncbi:hypothetical protein HUJ04_011270 [Dendroctonus ponderosae]|nr:hypothetical protein HUJ04_011270 [Dendroctonus ponderosae]
MKIQMKKILNEVDRQKFKKITEDYFSKLKNDAEDIFLNYLQKYYFQNKARINMESTPTWHWKTNQIKRKANITVETLLEKLDNLVDAKMWKRMTNMNRPNANNYQDRITTKAHKMAEKMNTNLIQEVGFGEFKDFVLQGLRIHRYKCECPDYLVRTNNCKHIHYVCMFERAGGTNSVLDDVLQQVSGQTSTIRKEQEEEAQEFIEECKRTISSEFNSLLNSEVTKKMRVEMATTNLKLRLRELTDNINDDDDDEILELNEVR